MISNSALERRMTGQGDPRSAPGIMARGANVYGGNSMAAQSGGGPQFGRPPGPEMMPPGMNEMGPPGMGGEMPGGMDMAGAPGLGMMPVESPMAPIVANMGMQDQMMDPGMGMGMQDQMMDPGMEGMESFAPSPSGETMNPILAALQQGGPPGNGGVGGNPGNVSPEIMAAIVRRLGAGGGSNF